MEAEARSDVAQEGAIFNIGHFISLHVSDIHSEPVNVKVRFADVDEGRDDEEVDKFLEMKAANPVFGDFASFVADDGNAQPINGLEPP